DALAHKKTAPENRGRFMFKTGSLGLCRFGFVVLGEGRAGILALGIDVAIDEFDHGQRGIVAIAEAGLEDAQVAAIALLVARAENGEELGHLSLVANLRDGLATGMQVAALAQG